MKIIRFSFKGLVHPEIINYSDSFQTCKTLFINKVVIFVFFVHKTYFHSFIKLGLNHWCHMDYFNYIFTTFLGLEHVSCIAVYAGLESSQVSSKI